MKRENKGRSWDCPHVYTDNNSSRGNKSTSFNYSLLNGFQGLGPHLDLKLKSVLPGSQKQELVSGVRDSAFGRN